MREAIAYSPGSVIPETIVTAAVSSCDASIGDVQLGAVWETNQRSISGLVASTCDSPVWLELPAEPSVGKDGLMIIMDTLRADHVGAYTPNITAHAESGWHGTNGWAPSPWTLPSVSALFTGRPPWAITNPGDHRLPQQLTTIAEMLPSHQTWMITTNAYISSSNGFDQGFSRFAYAENDEAATELARLWLAEPATAPRLLVVQLMSAHLPYQPSNPPAGGTDRVGDEFWDLDGWQSYRSEEHRERIRSLYRAVVTDLDTYVGEILGMVDDTWVTALVSDHGEEHWDHHGFEHGHAFWEEITKIHASLYVPNNTPIVDESLYQTQAFGQRFALALGITQQDTWAPMTDASSNIITFSHPLDTRDEVLHRWGVRSMHGELFSGGSQMYLNGVSTELHQQLYQLTSAAELGDSTTVTTCRLDVVAGQQFTIPSAAIWPDDSPPSSWGLATSKQGGGIDILPSRTGSWYIQNGGGSECEITTEADVVSLSEVEEERLRALGYLQ